MVQCYITGVELPLESTYLLDIKTVHRVIRNTKQKANALEGLLNQLGTLDKREFYDFKKDTTFVRHDRRLVCESVASLLGKCSPEEKLFISWNEYRERKKTPAEDRGMDQGNDDEQDNDNSRKRETCGGHQSQPHVEKE